MFKKRYSFWNLISLATISLLVGCSTYSASMHVWPEPLSQGIVSVPNIPADFVYLQDIDSSIIQSSRYNSNNNFMGRQVVGYPRGKIVAARQAAVQLKEVNKILTEKGYNLVVYDAYRPQRSVDEFLKWSQDPSGQKAKAFYYPTVDKANVFELGYIAKKSGHSRGSTFDLTIIKSGDKVHEIRPVVRKLLNGDEIVFLDDGTVDMGSSFDLFHEVSHYGTTLISVEHQEYRKLLSEAMQACLFRPYEKEWWHYIMVKEPYPDTYFDFVV
ncbi:MAG: M15 family metallopeptidase [Amoebophilaceae bacterium]|nr:M15 family metallopeptidase [Amoebophilaceae bacterium]